MKSWKRILAHILYKLEIWLTVILAVFILMLLNAIMECGACLTN